MLHLTKTFLQGINSEHGCMAGYSSQCSAGKHCICKSHLHRIFLGAAKSVQCCNAKCFFFFLTECNSMKKKWKKKNLLLYKEII